MARLPKGVTPARHPSRRKREPLPVPPHPYRGSAVFHGVLAGLIVAIAAAVGARVVNALVVAAIYFVVATAWSWFRFRQRIRAHEAAAVEQPPRGRGAGEAR